METTKMSWNNPAVEVQQFVPQEFCGSCADGGMNYLFECNAGVSRGLDHGHIYVERYGSADTFDYTGNTVRERELGYFRPCNEKHVSPTTSEYLEGWFVPYDVEQWLIFQRYVQHYDQAFKVIIWRGNNNDNIHATENLDIESWEKNHS